MAEEFGCVTLDRSIVWISPFNSHAALRLTTYEAWQLWQDLGKIPVFIQYKKIEQQEENSG